jgi:ATP-binding protein involved in chromosome partitioning
MGNSHRCHHHGQGKTPELPKDDQQLHKQQDKAADSGQDNFKVAIPLAEGRLCNHFGHCEQFALIRVHKGHIADQELQTPPPHEPGLLPRWLANLGVNLIFAGGMGQRALSLFAESGIKVITGSPELAPEALLQAYLTGELAAGPNACDH